MSRPTIPDLAREARVSVTTVNRVLAGALNVRPATAHRVRSAAETIGFYGLGAIDNRIKQARPRYRFGMLLQQSNRTFYRMLAQGLKDAADADVELQIEFLDELTPQNVVSRMMALGESCDALAVVAAVHPLVSQAIATLQDQGVPVFALISQLSATGDANYVGCDNWKMGRTAAWLIHHVCPRPGKLGILVGNHRYRCQEMNESGFRSYFREYAPEFTLLEPLSTFETSAVAQEMTERLLREHADLSGLYVAGGGIGGAIAALRASDRSGQLVAVGLQLMDYTRAALVDGILTAVISYPLVRMCEETIASMLRALNARNEARTLTSVLPFEIFTRENV